MLKKCLFTVVAFLLLMPLTACQEKSVMQDGYYTAQAEGFSHGWKEFITITVRNGEIISAEYNAENESGFIKSWDNAYMKNMNAVSHTYPNEYTRNYAAQLLDAQSAESLVAITGASSSASSFQILASAVIDQAKRGDSSILTVETAS